MSYPSAPSTAHRNSSFHASVKQPGIGPTWLRIIALLLVSLLLWTDGNASSVQAQSAFRAGYLRSFPLGRFGSDDPLEGRFAEPGGGLMVESLTGLPEIHERLSLGLHFAFDRNAIDAQAFATSINLGLESGRFATVSEGSYNPVSITAGPAWTQPLGPSESTSFFLDLKAGVGVLFSNVTPLRIEVADAVSGVLFNEVLQFNNQPSFTYLVGLNIGWAFASRWRLDAFAEQSAARQRLEGTLGTLSTIEEDFNLSFVNVGLALALRLGGTMSDASGNKELPLPTW